MVILKRLKASSLVEVTVSMVVMVMVFSMALIIYLNVTGAGITSPKLQLKMFLQSYAAKTKREKVFKNEELKWEQYIIRKIVLPYKGNTDLLLCTYSAYNQSEKLVAERKELVYLPKQ